MRTRFGAVAVCGLVMMVCGLTDDALVHVAVSSNGDYVLTSGSGSGSNVTLTGTTPTSVCSDGVASKLVSSTKPVSASGSDAFGSWTGYSWDVHFASGIRVQLSVRMYSGTTVGFTQDWTAGNPAGGCNDSVALAFPSWTLPSDVSGVTFTGTTAFASTFKTPMDEAGRLTEGITAGPYGLVPASSPYATAIVVSPGGPLFGSASARNMSADAASVAIGHGFRGTYSSIPAGSHLTTLVHASDAGLTDAFGGIGAVLQNAYLPAGGRWTKNDTMVTCGSYWTDHGGYYNMNGWKDPLRDGPVSENIAKAVNDMAANGVPVHSVQLDDWWYGGDRPGMGFVQCVANWTTTVPEKSAWFPGGLEALHNNMGGNVSLLLYVPWFCNENVYDSEFKFQASNNFNNWSMPDPANGNAQRLYEHLFSLHPNVMGKFEHDFVNANAHSRLEVSLTRFGYADDWLGAVGGATKAYGFPTQLCLAAPADLLTSLHHPSMTNARASGDASACTQWDITVNAPFFWATGMRPSKDMLWTTPFQKGQPYPLSGQSGKTCMPDGQPYGHRDAEHDVLIALSSTGPLGVGDGAGQTNYTLLRRAVDANGYMLGPSRPLAATDATFSTSPPSGRVAATHAAPSGASLSSEAGATSMAQIEASDASAPVWHYAMGVNVDDPDTLRPDQELWPRVGSSDDLYVRVAAAVGSRAADVSHCVAGATSGCVTRIKGSDDVNMQTGGPLPSPDFRRSWVFLQFAGIGSNGWALIGETGKFYGVSEHRFESVTYPASGGVSMSVVGAPGESVTVQAIDPSETVVEATLVIGADGKASKVIGTK